MEGFLPDRSTFERHVLIFGVTFLAIFILFAIFGCIMNRRHSRLHEATHGTPVYATIQPPPMYSTSNNMNNTAVAVVATETFHQHHHGILKNK